VTRRVLLVLAAVQRPGNEHYRLIKYSQFPPLSLLTIAGLTPDGWEITVRDEHVESSEVDGHVDLIRHTMVTSRGCPHACDFCYKSGFWGPTYYESRPIADLERELCGIDDRLVFFLDDNLLANRRHARALFDVLRGSGIIWQAAASLDVARDPHYLDEAYQAGCRSLFVGFESLSPENMRGNNKAVNAATDYAAACRRFHDAGIMINGSFVFGFDCDGPDVFDRTLDFAIENKILTASFHVLAPLPGTRAFARLEAEGRILHHDWTFYDTCHAVFQPRRMTPEQLEAGYRHAKRQFATYGSILRRSLGLPGAVKRIAYNVAWMKLDPLWVAIIRAGLMPFATRIFQRVLRLNTQVPRPLPEAVPN